MIPTMIFALLSITLPASAAPLDGTLALTSSAQLVSAARSDVAFLRARVDNCTRFGDTIKDRMLEPIARDLAAFEQRLSRYRGQEPESCASRKDLDFVLTAIGEKLVRASRPQSELMGMSGDEAMTKALSADDSGYWPKCRPESPGDFKSTPELKAYFALKAKLVSLRGAVAALQNQTPCAKSESLYAESF